jgi:putative DNA primase/helicase
MITHTTLDNNLRTDISHYSTPVLDGKVSGSIAKDLAKWGYAFWLNEMDDSVWNFDRRWSDSDNATLRMVARDAGYAESRLLSALDDATLAIAAQNRKHPLREYLDSLAWDGRDHIASLSAHFTDRHDPIVYADGSTKTVFQAFLTRWLIGSVAKVFGDTNAARSNFVLVLATGQNAGKSHFARWLCPLDAFFDEKRVDPDSKDHSLARARTWVWELGELGSVTRRADVEALKAFLTATTVVERKPYGHYDTVKPAIASYIGTVNPDGAGFLVDTTGNRRFAVIELESIDWSYDGKIDVGQVWAQAMAMWQQNPRAYRLTVEEQTIQQQNADEHLEADILADMIVRLFDVDPNRGEWRITSSQLLDTLRTLGSLSRGNDRVQGREIARSLAKLGITSKRSNGATVYAGLQKKG